LIVDLKPDDEEFSQRLQAAFQSFIGLANLGAAQEKAPPLMLGSETVEGITIATSHYAPPKGRKSEEPIDQRFNFSPSSALVGNTFVLSSSLPLARDLVRALKDPGKGSPAATLVGAGDGRELARLIEQNRATLVAKNMQEKGNDRPKAEREVGLLVHLAQYLGRASLAVRDRPEATGIRLEFLLGSE
jgi:hypothetical protein